jgi:uncharacterized membrane protein
MKQVFVFATKALVSGLLIVIPVYLAMLLLLKGMSSIVGLVRPIAQLMPEWMPAENVLSLLIVFLICFLVGVAALTGPGHAIREKIEKSVFEKIPGYALVRGLARQLAGGSSDKVWKPALMEGGEGLLLVFIIEEFEDGRYTVFVPSIPTPFAGAVYVVDRKRVHPLDVPFAEALKTVSHWGAGARDLVAAMEKQTLNAGGKNGHV